MQPREEDYLRHLQTLCRTTDEMVARPALETAILRLKASTSGKFQHAEKLYYLRPALEQASSYTVA
ncbi:MAG: hypothetical protein WCI88_08805, partial [Chloroflexota bacterium]